MFANAVAAVVSLGLAAIISGLVAQAVVRREAPRWSNGRSHVRSYLGFVISGSLMASALVMLGIVELTNTATLGFAGSVVLLVGALLSLPRRRGRQV